jgi:hypothetical protein
MFTRTTFFSRMAVLCVFFLLSCAAFQRGLKRAAAECGGSLVAEVGSDLATPNWSSALETRAATSGLAAVLCAVQKVLQELAAGDPAPAATHTAVLIQRLPDVRRIETKARAEAWLAVHKLAEVER